MDDTDPYLPPSGSPQAPGLPLAMGKIRRTHPLVYLSLLLGPIVIGLLLLFTNFPSSGIIVWIGGSVVCSIICGCRFALGQPLLSTGGRILLGFAMTLVFLMASSAIAFGGCLYLLVPLQVAH